MENNKPVEMTQVKSQGGKFRWVAVSALLLAIGAIMRLVSPSFAGVSINWIITMYCITILVIHPSVPKAVAIGLVAGAINTITSKSPMPHLNLLSEPIGALTCVLLMGLPFALKVPNAETRAALAEAEAIIQARHARFTSTEALFDALDQETRPR